MNQRNIIHHYFIHTLIIAGLLSIPCLGQTKIACVGTSITAFQYATGNYPEVLGKLLGSGYTVANNGFGGITVAGYMGCWMYPGVISGKPDIITIELGTNDATANLNRTAFTADYNRLIDSFLAVSSHPRIWLVLPPPIWQPPNGYKSDTMALAIVPLVRSIATQRGFPTIDLFTPMTGHNEWTGDGIHPNLVGNDTIAHIFYRNLTGSTSASSPWIAGLKAGKPVNISLSSNGASISLSACGQWELTLFSLSGTQLGSVSGYGPRVVPFARNRVENGFVIARLRSAEGERIQAFKVLR